jgi:uncharacterized membrane protein
MTAMGNDPQLKIERAEKHIRDLNALLETFVNSDFYSVSVYADRGENYIGFEFNKFKFPLIEAALIVGDVLHNLHSALDILYYRAVGGGD